MNTKKLLISVAALSIAPLSAQEKKAGKLVIPPVTVIQNMHAWDGTSNT